MPPVHEPVAPVIRSQPVAFQVVSEHDEVVDETHRPSRRRRHGADAQVAEQPPLQMVETQAAAEATPLTEDDLPRRTKPRRRRGAGASPSEPLQLVETTHGTDADNASSP
jgi:hypothetical protein